MNGLENIGLGLVIQWISESLVTQRISDVVADRNVGGIFLELVLRFPKCQSQVVLTRTP
jgi:hypothetical protein